MEQNACRDDPSDLDISFDELFGADVLDKCVDHRRRGNIYSQRTNSDTKMACGSYGIIHIANLQNILDGIDKETDPAYHRRRFVSLYKTPDYDPITKGSSLQYQTKLATNDKYIGGYYQIPKEVQKVKQAIDMGEFVFTGTTNCDRSKTKKSVDKVMVMTSGPGHIIAIDGYDDDKKLFFVRNSSGRSSYDNGYIYLRYDDIGKMFTLYGIVERKKDRLKDKIKAKIAEKKKDFVYRVVTADNGVKVLKRVRK